MFARYFALSESGSPEKKPPQPEKNDLWLSTLRSPEFKPDARVSDLLIDQKHGYSNFYTETYKKKELNEPDAKVVRVRANVLDILEIDQLKETFTATFKLQFEYVDPSLISTWQIITYRKVENGKDLVVTVQAHVLGYQRGEHENHKIVLGKRPQTEKSTPLTGKTVKTEDFEMEVKHDMEVTYDSYIFVPKKDLLSVTLPKDHDWQNHVSLDWSFLNKVVNEHQNMHEHRQIHFFDKHGGHVTQEWKVQAKFCDRLHLQEMPFDRQLLRVQVVGEIPNYMMKFEPLFVKSGELKTVAIREDRNLPVQWKADDAPPPQLQVIEEHGELNRARFDLHIYVERDPKFHVINVCLFVWLFTQGTGVVFTRGTGVQGKPHDKMDCLLTLLLTTVAYKIILATWLPVKPYLTRLDKYLLACFFFQTLVIVYISFEDSLDRLVARFIPEDNVLRTYGYNFGAIWVYGACFLAHVCVAVLIQLGYKHCIVQRESWPDVYKKKHVWPAGTKLKPPLAGPLPDERAGKPEKLDDSESESEDSDSDLQKLVCA